MKTVVLISAIAEWNAVASYGGSDGIYIMHDLELVAAIEAWKQRRLDEIDTQIRASSGWSTSMHLWLRSIGPVWITK